MLVVFTCLALKDMKRDVSTTSSEVVQDDKVTQVRRNSLFLWKIL